MEFTRTKYSSTNEHISRSSFSQKNIIRNVNNNSNTSLLLNKNNLDTDSHSNVKTKQIFKEINSTEDSLFPDCNICFSPLHSNLSTLSCGHIFHNNCLKAVVSYHNKCPICRKEVNADSIIKLIYSIKQDIIDDLFNTKSNNKCGNCEISNKLVNNITTINQEIADKLVAYDKSLSKLKHEYNISLLDLKKCKNEISEFSNKRLSSYMQIKSLIDDIFNLKEIISFLYEKNNTKNIEIEGLKKTILEQEQDRLCNKIVIKNLMSSTKRKKKTLYYSNIKENNINFNIIKKKNNTTNSKNNNFSRLLTGKKSKSSLINEIRSFSILKTNIKSNTSNKENNNTKDNMIIEDINSLISSNFGLSTTDFKNRRKILVNSIRKIDSDINIMKSRTKDCSRLSIEQICDETKMEIKLSKDKDLNNAKILKDFEKMNSQNKENIETNEFSLSTVNKSNQGNNYQETEKNMVEYSDFLVSDEICTKDNDNEYNNCLYLNENSIKSIKKNISFNNIDNNNFLDLKRNKSLEKISNNINDIVINTTNKKDIKIFSNYSSNKNKDSQNKIKKNKNKKKIGFN